MTAPRPQTETKTCAKCGATLPIELFARNSTNLSGRRNCCRPCWNQYVYERTAATRGRPVNPRGPVALPHVTPSEIHERHKAVTQMRYHANPEPHLQETRAYKKSERGRIATSVSNKRSRLAHPEKFRAREVAKQAIKMGRLIRGSCEKCGDTNAHAHHEDYSKPLDVVWLCALHHRMEHGATR